ncbi:hypothetical protein [Aquimarina algicola]|uniref:Baseplate protein J-like domain-containing protein n=1 Tax=Aquimarina algicola TaxID=2589995 RepID=A0A504IZI7_9FLAO|nr:hypothetical protein [Aquimarina algicola]TPN83947.1 hypothetical protein FHK87_18455 [Aquimarina algicola]
MKTPSRISHPLKSRTGTSQRTRRIQALQSDFAPIDGKTLADRLSIISKYALQINYYEYIRDNTGEEYQELDHWTAFFEDSLPFQLSAISKRSTSVLDQGFIVLYDEIKREQSKQSLESLFNFFLNKIITPITVLFEAIEREQNSFSTPIQTIIKSSFIDALKSFIALHNASATFLCTKKQNFTAYLRKPWQLEVQDVYGLQTDIQNVKKGKEEAYLKIAENISTIFYKTLSGFTEIVTIAPTYIEESLRPLQASQQKRHEPHLALLFTFLELFDYLQHNINELGKKHLDYFYQNILKITPRAAVSDKAHIVFEVAKHLNEYPLPKDVLLKNGKDNNKQDIQFGLDHEIILDKAQITELRTLLINKTPVQEYIEGIYTAPVANSLDGLGKAFAKDQSKNWATLGGKYSKYVKEEIIQEHPKARLGFVLSSPVLLLQEGERSINIVLDCYHPEKPSTEVIAKFGNDVSSFFKVWLSGADEWIEVLPKVTTPDLDTDQNKIQFLFEITLSLDMPPVTFYDEEKLKEKINVRQNFPVVKIELNDAVEIDGNFSTNSDPYCFLKRENSHQNIAISPYDVLQGLQLTDAKITVNVCGVKNIIAHNDDGALDPNSQMFPFGLRPNVPGFDPMNQITNQADPDEVIVPVDPNSLLGPSFYIGSKEVLFKKWEAVRVNIEWKEKPNNFNDHYKAYLKEPNNIEEKNIELKNLGLNEEEFKIKIDTLEKGDWKPLIEEAQKLFTNTTEEFNTLKCNRTVYGWEVQNFEGDTYVDFDEDIENFKSAQNGFLRFTLYGQDFLHKEYPFVLGRQMLAYALSAQGEKLTDAIYITSNKIIIRAVDDLSITGEGITDSLKNAIDSSNALITEISDLETFVQENKTEIDGIITAINDIISDIDNYINTDVDPFNVDLGNFNTGRLSGLNNFLTTLSTIRDTLYDRNTPQLVNRVNAIESAMQTIITNLTAILLGSGSTDGIQKISADLIDAINNASGDLATVKNDLIGPATDIKDGIDDVVTIVDNADAPNNSDSIKAKIDEVITFINGIRSYIENDFDTFRTNLQQYISDSLIQVMGELVSRFASIRGQFIIFKGELEAKGSDINDEFTEFVTVLLTTLGEGGDIYTLVRTISDSLKNIDEIFKKSNILKFFNKDGSQALIPNEPWTPTIKGLHLDYTATADSNDMDIIHLYPYDNTSKREEITQKPTLFPLLVDEGTLFIGIENLTPGGTLSLLFQLAEATANSEMPRAEIQWQYLSHNTWITLRPDFNIVSDETDGLTVSGIVTIAVPDDINTEGNTLMPDHLYWLKVSTLSNAKAIAETIGIHTQAAKTSARLSKDNDLNRLNTPLEEGSVSKLVEADFSVKKVEQLYPSFGGKEPEVEGRYYLRVSEHLKHKGRALMLNDYEKIVLEGFSNIYKVKCISHTMGLSALQYRRDLELAPGYVVVTVIPDLTKLKSGDQLEPKAPVSVLEQIGDHLRKKTSPFAKIKVMNPRYEKVDVTISVQLYRGKSRSFYQKKLKEDITNLLAPWYLGDSEKIAFGQSVLFSDIVGFVEALEYIDFITQLELRGEENQNGSEIKPITSRSILTAGEIVIRIEEEQCDESNQDSEVDNDNLPPIIIDEPSEQS